MKKYEHDGEGTIIFPDGTRYFVSDLDSNSYSYSDGIDVVVAELNRLHVELSKLIGVKNLDT